MELPLLLLLLQRSTRRLLPAVPWLTAGQEPGQPRTGCGRRSTSYGPASTGPLAQPALSLVGTPPPSTHIFGVKHQRMGTAPVPCPEGDTGAGFLAEGGQS